MVVSYFLLSAGLLSLVFSIDHAAWGQKNIMGEVAASGMNALTKHAVCQLASDKFVYVGSRYCSC